MKLDYECIKVLLEDTENQCDGFNDHNIVLDLGKPEEKQKAYHYKILIDQRLMEGKITEEGEGRIDASEHVTIFGMGKTIAVHVTVTGLSMDGHKLLEAMLDDNVWGKIKGGAKSLGIEGLKQIPGLAIQVLLKGPAYN